MSWDVLNRYAIAYKNMIPPSAIHDYNELLEKMKRYHMEEGDLGAYTDIFKYGMPPHGGLGIGLERVVMKMLGLANIREASLFPRDIHHLDP